MIFKFTAENSLLKDIFLCYHKKNIQKFVFWTINTYLSKNYVLDLYIDSCQCDRNVQNNIFNETRTFRLHM